MVGFFAELSLEVGYRCRARPDFPRNKEQEDVCVCEAVVRTATRWLASMGCRRRIGGVEMSASSPGGVGGCIIKKIDSNFEIVCISHRSVVLWSRLAILRITSWIVSLERATTPSRQCVRRRRHSFFHDHVVQLPTALLARARIKDGK